MKVLVLPSWYPTSDNPIPGCFFREQSLALSTNADVRILMGESRGVTWWDKLKHSWLDRPLPSFANFADTPPLKSFVYPRVKTWNEKRNVCLKWEAYERAFTEVIEEWSPDLLHAHGSWQGGLMASRLGRKWEIPVVLTEHSMIYPHRLPDGAMDLVKECWDGVSEVWAVGHHLMRYLRMIGCSRRIRVVGNLIDEEKFIPLATKKSEKFRILVIAYRSFIKDLDTFFRALAEVVKIDDQVEALVVGGGVPGDLPKGSYERMAKDNGVERYCKFLDVVERSEIPKLYSECDVFVMTSISETFCVSIGEALASGKPVVSTRNGGVEEMVDSGNVWVANVGDGEGIAREILSVREREKDQGHEARAFIESRFGKASFRERIMAGYTRVLEEKE